MFAGQTQVAHASSRGFDKVPLELFHFSWFLILLDVKSKGFWSKIGLILSSNPFKVFESSCLKNMSHWGGAFRKVSHIIWMASFVRPFSIEIKKTMCSPKGRFHQQFMLSFHPSRSQKCKKTRHFRLYFLFLGSVLVKAAPKSCSYNVYEIDPFRTRRQSN